MRLASPGLFSWFEKNVTVITPSRLQAAVAYRQFAANELRQGRKTWLRPSIYSLHAWLFRSWQEARYRSSQIPLLLSPAQEHLLWKHIIEQDKPDLFDSDATARLASSAARLIAEWEIPERAEEWPDRGDARQFKRWCNLFRQRCKQENWIIAPDLWRLLPEWFEQELCSDDPLAFLFAAPFSPALSTLQRSLGRRASFHAFEEPDEPRIRPGKGFDSVEAEFAFAARWARTEYEAHPGRSIAIVIPGASSRYGEIDRVFRDTFYPGSCRALTDPRLARDTAAPAAYHLLSPASLVQQPLVSGALLLLEIARDRIPASLAGSILRSPWIKGAAAERNERAAADTRLRRLRALDVSFADLAAACAGCPQLTKNFSYARRSLQKKSAQQPFSAWAEFIATLLGALGWPGDGTLDAAEQHVLEYWKDALSNLGSLSLICENVPFEIALDELRHLLDTPFEREGALLAPVQILEPSQAAGLRFDCALVTGLGEDTWPPRHAGNPLVPLSLQRRHNVPGSSQALLRRERERQLARLFACAPDVFATWSGRPSSAARAFLSEKTNPAEFVWQNKTTWESYKPAILDELEDSHGPIYIAAETARGGTGIIKSQSLCPFRAFAEYRLSSQSPEEGCLGYDARDRGGHLHSVLEFVWQKLGNSKNLKTVPPAGLEALVEEGAREAIRNVHPSSFGKIVHEVELARLKEVTLEWLQLEKDRLVPFTVEMVEEDRTIDLAGLKLRLRLDRMDRLPDGGLILIDYKSGEQKRSKLVCPRPDEPQLLVYAAGIGDKVEGILFAQLKQRDVRPHGWTKARHFRAKTVDALGNGWEKRMAETRAEVERLAEQFQSGYAAVDPKVHACNYCAQVAFCRIHEHKAAEGTGDE